MRTKIRVQICICIPNLSRKVADPSERTIHFAAQWSPIAMANSPRPYLHAWTAKVLTAPVSMRLMPRPPHIPETEWMWHAPYRRPSATMASLHHGSRNAGHSKRFTAIMAMIYRYIAPLDEKHASASTSIQHISYSYLNSPDGPRDSKYDNLVPRRALRHDTYGYLAVATKPNSPRILTSGHRLCFRPLPMF